MKIGIDATWATATGTGTASYTSGLIRSLIQHPDHQYVLYFRSRDSDPDLLTTLDGPRVEHCLVDGLGQPGRSLLSLARAARRDHLDVFHSPGYFLPLWNGPKVVTFHDVNMFLQWDKWWRPGMRASWLSLCAQTLLSSRLAKTILTDSEDAARATARVLRLRPEKISVLYPGVDDRFFTETKGEEGSCILERHSLEDYLLSVGVLSPQKNLEGVVRAFAEIRSGNLKLAIVGRDDGPYFRECVQPLIDRLGLTCSVEALGVVPNDTLPLIYRRAKLLVYPSFAEGFGLPPLEAMASGTAVVASNRSSLPEILGNAARLVDPDDARGLAAAIDQVLVDENLRRDLQLRGHERASLFRWSETAKKALDMYASAAATP
jgi:glycosyltransferase involved in cell wall biosynthesis